MANNKQTATNQVQS